MFQPLKSYFDGLKNCPPTIQSFLSKGSALFWLKFVEAQLALSNQYVLQTESRKITSFEVAVAALKLRDNIENRQQSQYIPAEAAELFDTLELSEQAEIKKYVENFYSELCRYLLKWSRSLDGTEVFSWMSLFVPPDWEKDVKPAVEFIQQRFSPSLIDVDSAFDETFLLRAFVSENLVKWNAEEMPSEMRWTETFKGLNSQHRPINQLSLLVQYGFSIPGTSTEVERLFSVINGVWEPEKGHMQLVTLESILNVKINSDLNCEDYFAAIKDNKKLLSQVQSSEKYKASASSAPS